MGVVSVNLAFGSLAVGGVDATGAGTGAGTAGEGSPAAGLAALLGALGRAGQQ